MWLRRLLWLIALAMFACPSWIGSATAMDRAAHAIDGGCHDAPPPPCPEHGTAKHAAGLCCPLMSAAAALLPHALALAAPREPGAFGLASALRLTGLSPHQDPPPPRV
jgi:hypothetical protein